MSRQVFVLLDFIQLVIFSIVYTYLFEKYFLWILISRVILWPTIESTGKCKLAAKLGIMFEKDLIWCEEI